MTEQYEAWRRAHYHVLTKREEEIARSAYSAGATTLRASEATVEKMREALKAAIKVADEAQDEWDKAPSGMRAGKILIALAGGCPGYRADIDAIHAVLKETP